MSKGPTRRWSGAIEIAIAAVVIALIGLHAVWRMGYLDARTAHTVRMTDNSRTAYVAKNIVDGNGYTTNDIPASLVDFYDDNGKLHASHWENADRFPFTAYAIALLDKVTGSTDYTVGILLYNLLCWIAFLVVLYRLARTVWGERYSALFTVGLALLHPYTYMYLYWKDGDMLLLTTACLSVMYSYFRRSPAENTWKHMLGIGTLLAWAFLARPNLGGSFMLFFAGVALYRTWRSRREHGSKVAAKQLAQRELIAGAVALAWCLPFAIHSLHQWGSPLFSANGIYQLPLGTRFGMGTDTWWKYTQPHHPITLGNLLDAAPEQIRAKLTSSWLVTLKSCLRSYAIELFLACGLAAWLGRRRAVDAPTGPRPLRMLAWMIAFALLVNLALLPLYSYQNFNWRHYIGFGLPLLWLAGGRAIYLIADAARDQLSRAGDHVRANAGRYATIAAIAVVVWNFGSKGGDANALFVRTSGFIGMHWLTAALVLLALLAHRFILRGSVYPRIVALVTIIVIARYQPNVPMKQLNVVWFPVHEHAVADTLRQHAGLVSSLALQGEVAWMSGRRNIPAPELVEHLYSYAADHHLEIEDVYIESAEALLGPDGPFAAAAPGFEGYARLQRYHGNLPGYELVLDEGGAVGDPKFGIKPHPKASSIYRLADREALKAAQRSPDVIEIGDVRNVVHTAYGFGDYYTVDGRAVVAATEGIRERYPTGAEQPFTDTAITFFLDERTPTAVDIEFYAPSPTTVDFYWNLDLFQYDRPGERELHRVGTHTAAAAGWQTVHLTIPAQLTRHGLNLLGIRPTAYQPVVVCPIEMTDETCIASRPTDDRQDLKTPARPLRLAGATTAINANISMLIATMRFTYSNP